MSSQTTTDFLSPVSKGDPSLGRKERAEINKIKLATPQPHAVTRVQSIIAHLTGRVNPALMILSHKPRMRTSDDV
jgi:hypothetical protein